ncbi:glycosyl hydrolase [Pseudozyma hubeiensis SY62]|uniref:Glycosyl hydrolase n=1 Tax=Pseudozyma hubeiensis (strain SY62) TaxID=1305764 RepID=R9P496_PSEHS|nr:glycosyl hydrolase [Pseudozyma hubeiensis SY62]GAC96181.1 glycosyl hydrolase [Pseudozyma hubeiensis SY62]
MKWAKGCSILLASLSLLLLSAHLVIVEAKQTAFSAPADLSGVRSQKHSEPPCYPFCSAHNQDSSHIVSHVESTRYADRSGTLQWVDPRIGTNGPDPSEYGGMVPSVALPFAGVRTVPMTRENLVSGCAYHDNDTVNIGFLASRQPAIWMGDYGFATVFGGQGEVKLGKHERGHSYSQADEFVAPFKYAVRMGNSSEGRMFAELVGKSRAAMVQYTFEKPGRENSVMERLVQHIAASNATQWGPYIAVQASREHWRGAVRIDVEKGEISGYNTERMDYRLGPHEAPGFRGYFVYRFEYQRTDSSHEEWIKGFSSDSVGTAHTNATGISMHPGERSRWNELGVYGFVRFPIDTTRVRVRMGLSLISEQQARYNLDVEMPNGTNVEDVVTELIDAWKSKTDRIQVQGGTEEQKRILYTGIYHASQYPAEHAEPIPHSDGDLQDTVPRHGVEDNHEYHYYSGYTDSVHKVKKGQRYQSWSIWDIYRAQWNLLILFEPQRVVDMVLSLLDIYHESGFLPMWSTLAETNIMISTHADSLIAEAVVKGVSGFDVEKAWEAVRKDGTVPPEREEELRYEDREEYTPLEVRAGLTSYNQSGYVPLDGWSESTSRTLDYAYDDHAIAVLADVLGKKADADFFHARSKNYRHVFDQDQGLMAARLKNGTFLVQLLPDPRGRQEGFTEGNSFDYSFDVVQDVPGLAELMGGRTKLANLLDRHFAEGHNDQSNEPSHHIPYLYSLIGEASKTQRLVRNISHEAYSDQPDGYAGNEDCGQQSAWYIFSAMGIYPVDPVSGEYVVSSPFFERMDITIPARAEEEKGVHLRIEAPGSDDEHVYVANVTVNGRSIAQPKLKWSDVLAGGTWKFGLADTPQAWGNDQSLPPLQA